MVSRLIVAVALSVLPAHAVFAQKVTVEFDEAIDFAKYKSFAIRDGQLSSRNPALNNELAKKKIEAEIVRALTAKGLMSATGQADLNVRYHLGTGRKLETEASPAGWRGLGTRVVRVPYAEGTLVIDLRDPTTRSLVWRGIATDEERNPAKMADKLDDMVRKSLAKYPPKK